MSELNRKRIRQRKGTFANTWLTALDRIRNGELPGQQELRGYLKLRERFLEQRKAVDNILWQIEKKKDVDEHKDSAYVRSRRILSEDFERAKRAGDTYFKELCELHPLGSWAIKNPGAGPVSIAWLIGWVDWDKAKTAGAIWRYAGYDPTVVYNPKSQPGHVRKFLKKSSKNDFIQKGEVVRAAKHYGRKVSTLIRWTEMSMKSRTNGRGGDLIVSDLGKALKRLPYNKELKTKLHLLGVSLRNAKSNDEAFYGYLHTLRKEVLTLRNENGWYEDKAREYVSRYDRGTEAREWCKQGMLPPSHIEKMAMNWVVKLFISHWFEACYPVMNDGEEPPAPFLLEHTAHKDRIPIPYIEFDPAEGFPEVDAGGVERRAA